MKKIKKSIISMFMAFVLMFSFLLPIGQVNTKKASALSIDYISADPMPTVYYFSDSQPAFKDYLDQQIGLNVIYDTQPLITPQKLAFMLYTGYFWGFDQDDTNIVIIELRTSKVSYELLNELFECLQYQGCKVMFISPYQPELEDNLEFVDASMAYNMDEYAYFFKSVIRIMLDEEGYLRNNSILLADGRFFGLSNSASAQSYDALSICAQSTTLQRVLLYMYYNCDSDAEMSFEESLYQALWAGFIDDLEWELDYFNEDTEISLYIPLWEEDLENIDNYFQYIYEDSYNQQAYEYYGEICEELGEVSGRNIHILAHTALNQYVDIMNNTSSGIYYFNNYEDLFEEVCFVTPYIYAISIYPIPVTLDVFFEHLQNHLRTIYREYGIDIIDELPVYIWEEESFVDSDFGTVVRRLNALREYYLTECNCGGDCPECAQYDETDTIYSFMNLFWSLFDD